MLQELSLSECAASHNVPDLQSAVSFTTQPPEVTSTTTRLISVTVIATITTTSFTTASYTSRPLNTTTSRTATSTIVTGGSARGFGVRCGLQIALVGVLAWVIL